MINPPGGNGPNGDEPAISDTGPATGASPRPIDPGSESANGSPPPAPADDRPFSPGDDPPIAPADVASAGRSCSAILILLAIILLVLCIGTALRWIILS